MVISVKNIKCSGPFLTILLVALFLSDITCPASFATTPLPFPELPKADVGITRAVYRAAINLEGTAADGDNLIPVEVTVTGQAVGEGWARNRIFPQAMPIQDFPGSEDLFLDFADGTYLSARAPSEFSFLFSIPTRPEPSNNGHSLRIPVVFASVTRIELTVTTPDNRPVTITTDPPAPVTSTLNDDSWKVSVTPAPGTTLDLTVAAEPATARAATFSVSQDLSVFMAPGLVETNIGCTVQPLQGLTDRVIIETDRVITGLMGEMIESWNEEVSETGKSIVTLKLYSALEASFAFRILFQAEHPPGAPFTIPSVDFPEAAKVSGTITIRTEKNYYPVEESTLNVNRLSAAKDQIAYHFDTPDYRLTMGLKPDLLKFDARGTVLIEIWPDMIRTIADIELDVISGSLETCAIRLPAEFRCQSVSGSRISGWKPATGGISVNVGGLRDGQTVMKLEGFVPLQKGYPLKLRVPEFTGARNSHGIVGIRVLGHKIPEVNKPVNLFQTSKVNLPAWMKNISLAFQYSGKNISGNIALVKPVPTVDIQSVTLLEITNTNVIQETRARITVNQAPLFCLSIIPGGNAELDEISGALLADFERGPEGIVTLRFTRPLEPGKTEEFSFITLRPRPEGNDIRFPLPAYPGARHVEGYVAAKSRVEAMLSWKQLGKAEECGPGQLPYTWFTIGRGDHLLTFRHPGTVNLTMKQLPIRFKQSSESVFTISPSLVAASSRVTLNIEQGGMKWILLKLPDGAKKPEIRSHFLAGVQPFKDGWRIEFSSILKGETTLAVDYSIPFEQSAGFIELAPPEFSGRSRHTGVLGFKSTSDIELTESFDGMQGLARLKGTPPPDLKDIHSLYRLTEAGFPRLKLLISKVQHQEKQKAEISELTLQTLMESDSAVMTGVSAKINNPGNKQFLKVWLPESAELWGAYVDGKPVKSGQEESDGPPAHTIPLITKQADRSFTIQLVYRQAGIDRFSTAGKVSLQAPQMDVPVGKVSWDVQIPEGYRLMMPGGNMALVRSPRLDTPGIADVFVRSLSSILSWATPYLRALGYLLGTLLTWLWYAVLIGLLGGLVYLGILAVVWFLKVMVRIEIGPSLEFATKALILLFIIGIFAAISMPQFASMSDDSKIAKTKQDIDVIVGAVTRFNAMEPRKAETLNDLKGKYLVKLPVDSWGYNYYLNKQQGVIGSPGEDGMRGTRDDVYISYLPDLDTLQQHPEMLQELIADGYDPNYADSPRFQEPVTVAKKPSMMDKIRDIEFPDIGLANFNRARLQARGKACSANMRVLEGAIDMWEMDVDDKAFNDGRDCALNYSGGRFTQEGKFLTPTYVKKIPQCKNGGQYRFHSATHSVWCTKHNTVEEPMMAGDRPAPGPGGGGAIASTRLKSEESRFSSMERGLSEDELVEGDYDIEKLGKTKRIPELVLPATLGALQLDTEENQNISHAEHVLGEVGHGAPEKTMADPETIKSNLKRLNQARDSLKKSWHELRIAAGRYRIPKNDPEEFGRLEEKHAATEQKLNAAIVKQEKALESLQQQVAERQMEKAARLMQEQKYDEAVSIYRDLLGSPLRKTAEIALKNSREMKEERAKRDKKRKNKGAQEQEEVKRKVDEIRRLYIDRALAQAAVARAAGKKDGYRRKETSRLVAEKLDKAESLLLELKDTPDRRQALNEIADTQRQLTSAGEPSSPIEIHDDTEPKEELKSSIPQKSLELKREDRESMATIVLNPGDLEMLNISSKDLASGQAETKLREKLSGSGERTPRVMKYGDSLVVIGDEQTGRIIERLKRTTSVPAPAEHAVSDVSIHLDEQLSPRSPAPAPAFEPAFPVQKIQQNLLASIHRGLSRGALPLEISLPTSTISYGFSRGRAGHTVPKIKFRCFQRNSVYAWSVGAVGLLVLLVGLVTMRKPRPVREEVFLLEKNTSYEENNDLLND